MGLCGIKAQPYATVDLDGKKPEKYENRRLRSEKTGEKALTAPKRFFQNTFTHYNYYFNANNKVNEVVERAKLSYKDDYTQLLPFYNYNLDATAQSKGDLDSVIYKCTAGILLHDLRNSWIDDLYLLLGKAYLLGKNYDSAGYVFQYINYAWAPKDDGYDILLGSNTSNTNGIFTVATTEKKSIVKKLLSSNPSRNESLLWEARNYLEQNRIGDATGLLSILASDPVFPQRLQTDLHELIAYNFYKQHVYDSASWHLNKALDNAENRLEKSRWEFLCGQLYQLANNKDAAVAMFERSVKHTTDPLMEVYARLNIVSLATNKKGYSLQDNLDELYKLARRDKYEDFRDIIYYAAATLELQQKNIPAAKAALQKSITNSTININQKNKSFLLMADIDFDTKNYQPSYNFYDSTATATLLPTEKYRVDERKPALKKITTNFAAINKEDSVQHIAAMAESERNAFVRKTLRRLRKAQGLKDENITDFGNGSLPSEATAPTSLFGENASGDFYFNNASLKQKGYNEFKSKWGSRTNIDNWQRQEAIAKQTAPVNNMMMANVDDVPMDNIVTNNAALPEQKKDLSFETLMGDIPLRPEQMDSSNKMIAEAYFGNGITFQNELKDYPSAIAAYDSLLRRFPADKNAEQALYNLIFCYNTLGMNTRVDSATALLKKTYPKGKFTSMLVNGNTGKDALTNAYQNVYNLFITGDFEKAKEAKMQADAMFGKSYWTPQLLYMEAIYYVKQKDDSTAINRLQNLASSFPTSPLAEKANTMIDVLKRRSSIEAHLTNYNEERKEDAVVKRVDLNNTDANKVKAVVIAKDTASKALTPITKAPEIKPAATVEVNKKIFQFVPTDAHYVVLLLDKVDETYASEARNAFNRFNKERYYNQKIDMNAVKIDAQYNLVLFGPFANAGEAVDYIDKTKPSVAGRIVPWLQANKYSFSIISNKNLDLLKSTKDITGYNQFLKQIFPDKF